MVVCGSMADNLTLPPAQTTAVVDSAGRLVVPAHYRTALGFRPRQEVILDLDGDTIRITTVETALDAAIARAQALARKYDEKLGRTGSVVDEFIAERRREAARD